MRKKAINTNTMVARYRKRRMSKNRPRYRKYRKRPMYPIVELKNNAGLTSSLGSFITSWSETDLTNIGQGVTQINRIGDHITARSFSLSGVLVGGQSNIATDDNRNIVRIVLAWWDSSSASPCTANGATISTRIQRDEVYGRGLIKMLFNRTYILRSPGPDSTGYMPAMCHVKIWKKMRKYVPYSGTAGTTAGMKLILSIISDSALPPSPSFIQGNYFFKFSDT